MNKVLKKFLYCCMYVMNHIWVLWSNIRWNKSTKGNVGIKNEDLTTSNSAIYTLVNKLYKKGFIYTKDNASQLWDSIVPPPQLYKDYLEDKVRDDCDGFHSLVYHCLYNSGIECYILSVNAIGSGHCVLIYKDSYKKWRVIDYTTIHKEFDTIKESIEDYANKFPNTYSNAKSEVYFYGLVKYDYDLKRFVNIDIKKV